MFKSISEIECSELCIRVGQFQLLGLKNLSALRLMPLPILLFLCRNAVKQLIYSLFELAKTISLKILKIKKYPKYPAVTVLAAQ